MTKRIIRSHNTVLNRRSLFRSTIAKRVTISTAIILTILGGAQVAKTMGYQTYGIGLPSLSGLFSRGGSEESSDELQPVIIDETTGSDGSNSDPSFVASGGSSGSTVPSGSSGGSSVSSAPVSGTTNTNCSNKAIPVAACTTILSVEAGGAKNNPNVIVDTSQLPEGTVFKFDQPSWVSGSGMGSINATATFSSYIYNLNITLTESNGWKVTNYTQR